MRQLFKLIIISTLLFGCVKPIKGDLLIENVNVIDVQTGDLKTNFDVLLINDSIAKIQKHKQGKYNASKRIDGTDKYLILGLWDMHSHWIDTYEYFFPMMLSNGVVGIRDMWGNFPVL